jgi:hypothetical protein
MRQAGQIMTDPAKTPEPVALTGQRPLSPKEQLRRSQALACNLPEKSKPSCTGQAFLGMFFDGTGNNRDADLPSHKQSNVVRLWKVHLDNSETAGAAPPVYWRKEYVPGVGTPFPLIGEKDATTMGKAFANGGQSRIVWGLIQTINALHRYVKSGTRLMSDRDAGVFARGAGDGSASGALNELKKMVGTLKEVLRGAKPTVVQFNLNVFGFSRGAAEARVFCTWFYQLCEEANGAYTFAGVRTRIGFLGIFDTVAAVGVTSVDILKDEVVSGHVSWAKGTLAIHPAIERCVHFVATHEVRGCFPLDSVRYKGKYPANCVEVAYPGVHSDVGGGYRPLAQGRSALPSDNSYSFCALFPCIDMHKEALASGVPLQTLEQMSELDRRDFTASKQTVDDYNAFLKADLATGPVEEIGKLRMDRYRFYRYKRLSTFVESALSQHAPAEDADFLRQTNHDFEEKCNELKQKYKRIMEQAEKENLNKLKNPSPANGVSLAKRKRELLEANFNREDLEMWEGMHRVGQLDQAMLTFFDHYIHDSIAGFAQDGVREYKYNGRGHFRRRNVYDHGGA